MQNLPGHTAKKEGLLLYPLLFTLFFLLLEISFFIQCNEAYLSGIAEVSNRIQLPLTILPAILYFVSAQLLLHFCFTLFVYLLTLGLVNVLTIEQKNFFFLSLIVWLIALFAALMANQIYFPNSKFAALTAFFIPKFAAYFLFYLFLTFLFLSALLSIVNFIFHVRYKSLLILAIVLLAEIFIFFPSIEFSKDSHGLTQPNVIIVGMDSLRPDFVSFLGGERSTPFLDSVLKDATIFVDAITPLARTYPSWVTILTGQHPVITKIRSNLVRPNLLSFPKTLAKQLQEKGYETIFATDESRFSNIDASFGFDRVIVPPMGINDFLLGSINDFPFSNLLVNTELGKLLFPNSYANRAVSFTYQPNTFLNLIRRNLADTGDKPVFLAVHFCLPHFPYIWADLPIANLKIREMYGASVVRVDQQLKDFFDILQKRGLLKKAIVVLLSDHGEALEFDGDRITEKELYVGRQNDVPKFFPEGLDQAAINQSVGHGSDVLGLSQYHVLLAVKLFGLAQQHTGFVRGVVSIESIKPTILDLLKAVDEKSPLSLANFITANAASVPARYYFLETDFSPFSMRTVYPDVQKVMLEGIQLFRIEPQTRRLIVKDDMLEKVIRSKQRAVIFGEWMMAIYPQNPFYATAILINLKDGRWTDDLSSQFALGSPAVNMLSALRNFYGDELITLQAKK